MSGTQAAGSGEPATGSMKVGGAEFIKIELGPAFLLCRRNCAETNPSNQTQWQERRIRLVRLHRRDGVFVVASVCRSPIGRLTRELISSIVTYCYSCPAAASLLRAGLLVRKPVWISSRYARDEFLCQPTAAKSVLPAALKGNQPLRISPSPPSNCLTPNQAKSWSGTSACPSIPTCAGA